jgi:sugar/nucleoside kinase (ribokinase family)
MRGAARAESSPPPVEVIDAIGAGDSFDAGFVYGALAGWRWRLCGALSTRAAGGAAAQATLEEVLAWI